MRIDKRLQTVLLRNAQGMSAPLQSTIVVPVVAAEVIVKIMAQGPCPGDQCGRGGAITR